jgi:hypothetical protein
MQSANTTVPRQRSLLPVLAAACLTAYGSIAIVQLSALSDYFLFIAEYAQRSFGLRVIIQFAVTAYLYLKCRSENSFLGISLRRSLQRDFFSTFRRSSFRSLVSCPIAPGRWSSRISKGSHQTERRTNRNSIPPGRKSTASGLIMCTRWRPTGDSHFNPQAVAACRDRSAWRMLVLWERSHAKASTAVRSAPRGNVRARYARRPTGSPAWPGINACSGISDI